MRNFIVRGSDHFIADDENWVSSGFILRLVTIANVEQVVFDPVIFDPTVLFSRFLFKDFVTSRAGEILKEEGVLLDETQLFCIIGKTDFIDQHNYYWVNLGVEAMV